MYAKHNIKFFIYFIVFTFVLNVKKMILMRLSQLSSVAHHHFFYQKYLAFTPWFQVRVVLLLKTSFPGDWLWMAMFLFISVCQCVASCIDIIYIVLFLNANVNVIYKRSFFCISPKFVNCCIIIHLQTCRVNWQRFA